MTSDRLLRAKDAAAYLRIGQSTFFRWLAEGRIPSHPGPPGSRIRWYRTDELDAFVRGDYRPQIRRAR